MPKTPSKMHMYDIVKTETIVFEIVGRGEAPFNPPPLRTVSCLKHPGSDKVLKKVFKKTLTFIGQWGC